MSIDTALPVATERGYGYIERDVLELLEYLASLLGESRRVCVEWNARDRLNPPCRHFRECHLTLRQPHSVGLPGFEPGTS